MMIWRTGELSPFLYRGGFMILSLATVLVLMPLTHPACRLGTLLGVRPLRWVGVRSYGIYLWQTPVIVLTTPQGVQHKDDLVRDAAAGGGDLRHLRALLALRRGADPPRRDRALLRPPPRGRLEMGDLRAADAGGDRRPRRWSW